ncbi:MAG: carbon starvation protein A [Archaeoglobaceae archaeon]|nr:carbon starvation protein A [Archaeoglobaceae archaeon]
MNSALIIFGAAIVYVVFYFLYGKNLERKIIRADPSRKTPAHRLYDGVDYVPAHPVVLYGHHFASIAGAGPIVGPAVAMAWGWLPGLLWVWFGNVFIGAVHDYLALMSSVRHDGKSIQWLSGKLMTKRTGYTFEVYIFFALILVLAAFTAVIAGIFTRVPEVATASIAFIAIAIITGFIMYKAKINFYVSTVIGLILLASAIWFGFQYPIKADFQTWALFLFVYSVVASSLPVWVLLQPRDYLNAYILWLGLLLGGLAFIIIGKNFSAPAFTSFSANVVGGKPSPFWPTVPLIVACGALSGFHALVGSGTSSKQLDNELHGLLVGYGGMFTEGFLSTIVIVSIAVYGFTVFSEIGASMTSALWGSKYAVTVVSKGIKVGIFSKSYAHGLKDAFGIPLKIGDAFASLWVAAFALTTLDTATRLARFTLQEIVEPLKGSSIHSILSNKWIASIIPASIGVWMALAKNWLIIWPAFSGMNQLLASIALMTSALWVAKVVRPSAGWKMAILIPALFLWITVTAALIWFLVVVRPSIEVSAIILVSLALNFMLFFDFANTYRKPAEHVA